MSSLWDTPFTLVNYRIFGVPVLKFKIIQAHNNKTYTCCKHCISLEAVCKYCSKCCSKRFSLILFISPNRWPANSKIKFFLSHSSNDNLNMTYLSIYLRWVPQQPSNPAGFCVCMWGCCKNAFTPDFYVFAFLSYWNDSDYQTTLNIRHR